MEKSKGYSYKKALPDIPRTVRIANAYLCDKDDPLSIKDTLAYIETEGLSVRSIYKDPDTGDKYVIVDFKGPTDNIPSLFLKEM